MLLGKRNKFHNPMIEALEEPAFIFSHNNEFLFCNDSAREILKILNYKSDRKPENIQTFIQILHFSSAEKQESCISFQNMRYGVVQREYEEGYLLRLIPQKDNDHLLRLSYSLDVMPWGLVTVQLSEKIPVVVFCNEKAGDFLAMPSARMIGSSVSEIFRVFGMDTDYEDLMCSGEIRHYDHEIRRDGKIHWYRFHFIPYTYQVPHCLIVIEDSTEGKIKEGHYFQAQRLEALGQLAGGVAHDFNNILSIIDGYARMAKKTVVENPDALNYLERILQSVQRGSALTGRLLTFGRHKVVKDMVVDLGALVQDQEPLLRPLMDASISMRVEAEEGIYIDVAADHICQILMNLCINSRDAMKNGGNLIIECGRSKDRLVYLRVIDTGEGMTPEVRAQMFDPFFTTKDQGKGTGLGLSMVYSLVKDMKGEIDVVSKQGQGTSITITLPLSEKRPPRHGITEDEDGNIHLEGITALVAEDEPDLLDLVSGMMEDMGAKVIKACNGSEALRMQNDFDGDIDILLTDVVMPELNGVKLAELFHSLRPDSKVMFMSGYPENGQMARVPLPEDALFIPKPVDYRKLGSIIRNMISGQDNKDGENWDYQTGRWRSV